MTKVTGIVCPTCKAFIFSRAHHDFHYCKCGECFVDGGFEYLRFGWTKTQPIRATTEVRQTQRELFSDWNKKEDKYGIIEDFDTGTAEILQQDFES